MIIDDLRELCVDDTSFEICIKDVNTDDTLYQGCIGCAGNYLDFNIENIDLNRSRLIIYIDCVDSDVYDEDY